METIIESTDIDDIDMDVIRRAADILRAGGLVAFPTETVYGLGADGLSEQAAAKIYAAKGRPSDNPLIVHIADLEQLNTLAADIPENAKKLAEAFWPGPLTMIFKKSAAVPDTTTGGLDTVAVRMPEHPIARALIRESDVNVAAPSANLSGRPSPTSGTHVIDDMYGRIDMIIDGGETCMGLESTIVDVTCTPSMILRPGFITKEMIEDIVGTTLFDKGVTDKPSEDARPKAPGMKYRHYAPSAELVIFDGDSADVVDAIVTAAADKLEQGIKVGIIATDENKCDIERRLGDKINDVIIYSLGTESDMTDIAGNLYRVLRDFDKTDVEQIYGETFLREHLGQAVMNRLCKAAGYNIVRV